MKVAAFDFDGTLRRGPKNHAAINTDDIAAIDAWRDAGHLAISATGRSRSSLARWARRHELHLRLQRVIQRVRRHRRRRQTSLAIFSTRSLPATWCAVLLLVRARGGVWHHHQ